MSYQVLDSIKDKDKWMEFLDSFNDIEIDIYYLPEYMNLSIKDNNEALLFIYSHDKNFWIYPFFLTSINKAYLVNTKLIYKDIETAYGYSGPLSNSSNINFIEKAQSIFSEWCHDKNVVAEFIRFHPLLKNTNFYKKNTIILYDRKTISINLEKFNNEKNKFDAKTRNIIKKFYKENNYIKIVDSKKDYDLFKDLYLSNMKKKDATNFYYFDEKYFDRLFYFILEHGCIINAYCKNNYLIGGAFILFSNQYAHYHLASSLKGKLYSGTSNAIIEKAIYISLDKNKKLLHLGGGVHSDNNDSLFKFKESMGNIMNEFYIGKKIYNPHIYNDILNVFQSSKKDYDSKKVLFYK